MSDMLSINPRQSALLVMDYQNVLIDHYVPGDQVESVLSNIAGLIEAARSASMLIIHVMVAFRHGHPEVSRRNRLFSLLKDSGLLSRDRADTELHPIVAPAENEPVVIKHRVGAFTGTDLETLLRSNGIESLVLAGITTGGVVLSTTRQAFDMDYRIVVAEDCCADSDRHTHQSLLEKAIQQHAEIVSAKQIIDALSG
ncbi:TPA: cysteine hydrolase family protein [Burkholderia cepacia]|uniref:cysteine hydrolase family protein n=1 Tax=Burkholderia cepacia TaxID=292 RepID=UPI001295E730|nr:isochorismatase family cysteine hydrolase [Burkholderia cepacia]